MLTKTKDVLSCFEPAIEHEWLETNGLGGWAGSSLIGVNTRRYHGLLVAAVNPPVDRMVLLSKLDETIIFNDEAFELGSNLYPDKTVYPAGYKNLVSFRKEFFPEWIIEVGGITIRKKIAMVHGENSTLIEYEVLISPGPFKMELCPLVAFRGYHKLNHFGPHMHWDASFENDIFHSTPDGNTNLYIKIPGAEYTHNPLWYYRFQYPIEQYRGLDFEEDLFSYGKFTVELKEGSKLGIIVSTENPGKRSATDLLEMEISRRKRLLLNNEDSLVRQLLLAADQFIVQRDKDLKTVIAGYHWFGDWGRDTMISLPGLTLSTGRLGEARKILAAFSKVVSEGMLPNRFQEKDPPEYNNVDGTLWYFIAVYRYLKASGDSEFVLGELLPVLNEIIEWHYKGTRYNIHVDDDHLLFAGETGQQLTWMDAKVGDWVITPRAGKPVEIQALWYNALLIFAELLDSQHEKGRATEYRGKAAQVKESFNKLFWFDEGKYLYDVIDPLGNRDASIRPNQLFAISLPFKILDEHEKIGYILNLIERELYTPVGLRSLSATHPGYIGKYGGDALRRDSSYHQGTVWSWLLGPYVDALMEYEKEEGRSKAKKVIASFEYHLNEAGIGSVSEIFDGDSPHHPRGCVAQAWGVAEILRIIKDYSLIP